MAHLIYATNISLDGYIEGPDGRFDWSEPDEVVHQFFNDLLRPIGTHLYGRRLYETMMVWETNPEFAAESPVMSEFAQIWQAGEKIVYSKTLEAVSTRKTRIERSFDPAAVERLKKESDRDLLIGGANLAAQAFRSGLIDECYITLSPVIVGGGKRGLPENFHAVLELVEQWRFGNGMIALRYRVR